jgi:hypothetical protein
VKSRKRYSLRQITNALRVYLQATPQGLPTRPNGASKVVGLTRFELVTPRLSSVCSNQLSYRPSQARSPLRQNPKMGTVSGIYQRTRPKVGPIPSKLDRRAAQQHHRLSRPKACLKRARSIIRFCLYPCGHWQDSRKEVIQPQVLLQLPCYDFTPITDHTLDTCLPCGLAQRLLVQPAFVM